MYFSYSYLNYYIMENFFVNLIFKNLFLLHEKGQLCSLKLSCPVNNQNF